jgi:phosphoribosylformylglycinamidine (FGAM) synthase-like enzyme
VRAAIEVGTATAVHDLSDGGLAIALAEMALAGNKGAVLREPPAGETAGAGAAAWYGEDQARYVLTVRADAAGTVIDEAQMAGIRACRLGVVKGSALVLGAAEPLPVAELRAAHEHWFPDFMTIG